MGAPIVLAPKTGGDSTPLGQRPLHVLPCCSKLIILAQLARLNAWFRSVLPKSVYTAMTLPTQKVRTPRNRGWNKRCPAV